MDRPDERVQPQGIDDPTNTAPAAGADEPIEYEPPARKIGWKKGAVIVLLVVGVWTVVELRRTGGNEIPWLNDLPRALQQAQNPPKAVVLLIHKRACPVMAELEQTVFNLDSTYRWAIQGVPCRLIWEEHPEVVGRYSLKESPSLLCLTPQGDRIWEHSGYGITPQIRKRFLKYVVGEKDEGTFRSDSATSAPASKQK